LTAERTNEGERSELSLPL